MKKLILSVSFFGSLGILLSNGIVANAIQSSDTKKAQFNIVTDPNGTILVEAQDLIFGEYTVSPDEINAQMKTDSEINITEYSGNRPGWTLKAQLSKFTDGETNIDGIRLFYPQVTATTTTGGSASTDSPTTNDGQSSFVNSLQGVIVNDDNVQVKIAGATKGKGYGKWTLSYSNDNKVQLSIPSNPKIGSYSADIIYTIEDSPTP